MTTNMKRIGLAALLTAVSSPAWSQCVTLPYTLTNGTVANADQVMADMNCLVPKGDGTFTNNIQIKGGAIAINRRASDGLIFNTNMYGYQFTHYGSTNPGADQLQLQAYMPSGPNSAIPLSVDALGRMAVNNNGTNASYTFYVNGISAGTSQWYITSDARLKKNVADVTDGIATIMKLRPVHFAWKDSSERAMGKKMNFDPVPQIGFIAQEVAAVVPEAVRVPTNDQDPYTMSPTGLIPILVQAVKEQQAEIKALQDQLATLKAAQ